MVGEIGMGNVGVVLGLEVSRLARNSSDWHRLVEICAFTDTLMSMRMVFTIRLISMIACCWGLRGR